MNSSKTKICVRCNLEKSIDDFYKDITRQTGISTYCKACVKEARNKYREEHKETVSKTKQKYYKTNSEYIKKKTKKRYKEKREEILLYHKEYRKENKETIRTKDRKRRLLERYGITEEHYNLMLTAQDNSCFICNSKFTEKNKPKIDHNHTTNRVRKLLCNRCNIMVGFIEKTRYINMYLNYIEDDKLGRL